MTRHLAVTAVVPALILTAPAMASPKPVEQGPNIVLIVLDDTGYADLGAYGSEIRTPNIDRLAADGLRFTRFETKAICSPTRAALMTGRNSHTVGMADLVATSLSGGGTGKDSGILAANAETVAQALRTRGYATWAVGKWHLAPESEDGRPGNNAAWPLQRGFDHFYGFTSGWADQYRPDFVVDNRKIGKPREADYHFSSAIVDQAIGRMSQAVPGQPFFLYLAFGATHAPLQVPASYIERYRGVYERGWDAVRAGRFARQKQLGIVPGDAVLSPRPAGDRAWDTLTPVEAQVYARYMATYAAFLEHADAQIGRLIARFKADGSYDRTLFVLLSDNGAAAEAGQTGSIDQLYPPKHLPAAQIAPRLDEFGRTWIEYPRPWAMTGATPFARYKAWPQAGGVRTPLIVTWAGHVPDAGGVRPQPIDAVDIAPTLLAAAGARFHRSVQGIAQLPVAGASFLPVLRSAAAPAPRDVQYFELRGNRAIRRGRWRAVAVHRLGTRFEDDRWALYDTRRDPVEGTDVSAEHPRTLARLKALWRREAARHGALPLTEGPAYVRRLDQYRDAFSPPAPDQE